MWAAGSALLFCAVLVTLDVFARNLFNDIFFESYDITICWYAVTVAFSFSFALTTKTHIRIDVIYAVLSDTSVTDLYLAAMIAGALLAAMFSLAIFVACVVNPSLSGTRGGFDHTTDRCEPICGSVRAR